MSASGRWFLGLATLGLALMCAYLPLAGLIPENAWIMWALAALCLTITIACVPGRHGRIFGRILAAVSGAACTAYLITELIHRDPGGSRSSPSLGGAITMFVGWGLPALLYAFSGVMPRTGRLGEVAHAIGRRNKAANPNEEGAFAPKAPGEESKPALH